MLHKRLTNFAVFFHNSVEKGLLLFVAMLFALFIANSVYADSYNDFLYTYVGIYWEKSVITLSMQHFVNDFLMAIFFLMVGLEIKREFMVGHLSDNKLRILPIVAALGGVIVPIIMYIAINYEDEVAMRGWAIPAATDIAFALGVLAFVGKGLPSSLRVFLTALAIIDDLIAVSIIAFFYSDNLALEYFVAITFLCFILYTFNRSKLSSLSPYLIVGLFLWYAFYKSGVHATLSGVVLALFIPRETQKGKVLPLRKLERALLPYVAYFILPFFAFVNSGVNLEGVDANIILHNSIALGIVLGLFVGKQLGIFFTVLFMEKMGLVKLPEKTNHLQFYGVSILCGIGFTMSLFIGILAFEEYHQHLEFTKIGVLFGSFASAIFGAFIFKLEKFLRARRVFSEKV